MEPVDVVTVPQHMKHLSPFSSWFIRQPWARIATCVLMVLGVAFAVGSHFFVRNGVVLEIKGVVQEEVIELGTFDGQEHAEVVFRIHNNSHSTIHYRGSSDMYPEVETQRFLGRWMPYSRLIEPMPKDVQVNPGQSVICKGVIPQSAPSGVYRLVLHWGTDARECNQTSFTAPIRCSRSGVFETVNIVGLIPVVIDSTFSGGR